MRHLSSLRLLIMVSSIGCSGKDPSPSPSSPSSPSSPEDVQDLPGGLSRVEDPVVLTGALLLGLGGAKATDIVAFSRQDGSWQQIPVQVDERLVQDFCEIYGKSSGRWNSNPACKTSKVVTALFYADAGTYTGADPDPLLDLDDELVFMARDGGDRVGSWSDPAGVIAGSGVELELRDGDAQAWVYVFERQDSGLEASAGQDYVRYTFSLNGLDYKSDYDLYGTSCGGEDATCNPTMTEDSIIEGAAYTRHFVARWMTDSLQITAGDATGVDILDLHQSRFSPDSCGRHVLTYSTAEGAFIANIDGPVRAIRSYLGANSGPLTQRDHHFYDHREDIVTQLRVHATSAGIMDLLDYSPAAAGMTYYNDLNPDGLTVDGIPDAANEDGIPQWEMITGAQGSVVMTGTLDASFETAFAHFFWADEATPSFPQCNTSTILDAPDGQAIGTSGIWLDGTLPDTDPKNGSVEHSLARRILYYQPPNLAVASALALVAGAQQPVEVRARPVGAASEDAACGDGSCSAGEADSCALDCLPVDGTCGDTVCLPPENSTSCAADCAFDTSDDPDLLEDCGDGTCDPSLENELSCAADCWPEYSDAIDCAQESCSGELNACADEENCVTLVLCVAECVETGGDGRGCIEDCAVELGEDSGFILGAAEDLLVCGNANGCF